MRNIEWQLKARPRRPAPTSTRFRMIPKTYRGPFVAKRKPGPARPEKGLPRNALPIPACRWDRRAVQARNRRSTPRADVSPNTADLLTPASVRRIDVPFVHLVTFFLKAVLAAIPGLILLGAILWGLGEVLQAVFPSLIKMKILISFPN